MASTRVCLTTFIYGVRYQEYIPFLVYSCKKAYPEYDIVLFLYDKLTKDIKDQLSKINSQNVYIHEGVFNDCPQMTPLKAKSLRWVLWDDVFEKYDYLYIVDIDMLYIREPKPLHEQHIEHMKTTGLPYDNLARCLERTPFNYISIGSRIKTTGLQNLGGFFFGSRKDYRLSGLHFIKVDDYFRIYNEKLRRFYRNKIFQGTYMKNVYSCNNESFLYLLMKEIGLSPNRLAIQTDSCRMLDFNNCERPEFRPHHGIHMGIFRQEIESPNDILDSQVYNYYVSQFVNTIMQDNSFLSILQMSSYNVKKQFDRLYRYYKLNTSPLRKNLE